MYRAVYRRFPGRMHMSYRRSCMERLFLYPDGVLVRFPIYIYAILLLQDSTCFLDCFQNVPEAVLKNVSGHIPQIQTVPKGLSDYTAEERSEIPRLFDFPEDFIMPEKEVHQELPKIDPWEWKNYRRPKSRYMMWASLSVDLKNSFVTTNQSVSSFHNMKYNEVTWRFWVFRFSVHVLVR